MLRRLVSLLGFLDDALEIAVLSLVRTRAGRVLMGAALVGVALLWFGAPAPAPLSPPHEAAADDPSAWLTERPWFDQFPSDPRKTYHVYFFAKNGTGAYIEVQAFRQVLEIFSYTAVKGRILYWFPGSGTRGETSYTLTRTRGPGTFDLALELAADPKLGGRKARYGSWTTYKRDADAGSTDAGDDLSAYLKERPWADRFPTDPSELVRLYYFGKNGSGAYIEAQNYKQVIEVCFYTAVRGRLLYWFPHSRLKGTTRWAISEATGPGSFDLRLELSADPKRKGTTTSYGSWKSYRPSDDASASFEFLDVLTACVAPAPDVTR